MNTKSFVASHMGSAFSCAAASALALTTSSTFAATNNEALEKQIDALEQRIEELESTKQTEPDRRSSEYSRRKTTQNLFNPAISVILDGVYANYENNPENYTLPGFTLGNEAELVPEGFSLGHSELVFSNNIDDKFYGQLTLAIVEHEGELEVELEEAYFETLSLGGGFRIRGGRFYSAIGYLNQQHQHVWDFQDAPLVYRGIFGNQYFDDGLRVAFVAPTDLFLELGAEAFTGNKYPGGGEHSDAGTTVAFANLGGDIGYSHSWQAGISYSQFDKVERTHGGHAHGGGTAEVPLFGGDSKILGLNAIYKWAPDGNYRDQNVKIQFEYFKRDEDGDITLEGSSPLETSTLDSKQDGWYAHARWKFASAWATAIRFDMLDSDNTGSDPDVLDEAGLVTNGHTPRRFSVMGEWAPSEYSRIRLQYNRDESYQETDNQVYLQYTFSIGSHGAHAF